LDRVVRLRDIPTLSVVLKQAMERLQDPKCPRSEMAEVLRRDQVLTAKVLRLVNSGFYARDTHIHDMKKALSFLGDNTISALILGTSTFSAQDLEPRPLWNLAEFWNHSLAVAQCGEKIATLIGYSKVQDVFTAGLLHGLGKLALFRADPATFFEVLEVAAAGQKTFLDAELSLDLPGYHVMGERLADSWSLPLMVRKVIRYHPRDVTHLETLYSDIKPVVMMVSLARTLCVRSRIGLSGDFSVEELRPSYIEALGLNATKIIKIEGEILALQDAA
jgi:HD-like signal output (HDOD) protein